MFMYLHVPSFYHIQVWRGERIFGDPAGFGYKGSGMLPPDRDPQRYS